MRAAGRSWSCCAVLAHWMMKEPELEEEALWAEVTGQRMRILRRTLAGDRLGPVTVTAPDGSAVALESAPNRAGPVGNPL